MNENFNSETNEKIGIIRRLIAKLHTAKISQKATSLILGIATVVTMSACDNATLPDTNNTDSSISDSETSNTDKNNANNNIQNNGGNTSNNINKEPVVYSPLLQNILDDEYYNNLIKNAKANPSKFDSAEFDPHPYAFFEDEGYDIEAIKRGEIKAYTMSYVTEEEPNNIYMYSRVNYSQDACANYLLKYELNDEEMADYRMLHSGKDGAEYFIQAAFINNEISETRTPTIIGECKMSKNAYDQLQNGMSKLELSSSEQNFAFILNPDKENMTFSVFIMPKYYDSDTATFNGYFSTIECTGPVTIENGLYIYPYHPAQMNGPTSIKHNATIFRIQDVYLNHAHCDNLQKD